MHMCRVRRARPDDRPHLLDLWERAVRATHGFLTEHDIAALRPLVDTELASDTLDWWVLASDTEGAIAFLGTTPHAIEALFVDPAHRRCGAGTRLVAHAQSLAPTKPLAVDVNEQNESALGFYECLGFERVGRSPLDADGRPFPLVHLKRTPRIRTRPLSSTDATHVLRLNAAAGCALFPLDERELARLLSLSPAHRAALAGDGSLAGYVLAFRRDDAYDGEEFLALRAAIGRPFLYIDQVAVDARWRHTGVGRRLYADLAVHAPASGATDLCCEVNLEPPNEGSMAFHRQLGFDVVSELATQDGRRVALLRKRAAGRGN